jgi:hypothetical protein
MIGSGIAGLFIIKPRAFGNYSGILIAYGKTLLKSHSEEPVLFPATKNLAFGPVEEILRHCGAGRNVQHLRSSE